MGIFKRYKLVYLEHVTLGTKKKKRIGVHVMGCETSGIEREEEPPLQFSRKLPMILSNDYRSSSVNFFVADFNFIKGNYFKNTTKTYTLIILKHL